MAAVPTHAEVLTAAKTVLVDARVRGLPGAGELEPLLQARAPNGRERLVRARVGCTRPAERGEASKHEHGVREQQQAAARAVRGERRRRRQLGHLQGRRAL